LITPHIVAGKATEIFCENMKVLLLKNKKYKWSIFKNYNIDKNFEGLYVKNRLKTDYNKV
jgi:hypothetical protein